MTPISESLKLMTATVGILALIGQAQMLFCRFREVKHNYRSFYASEGVDSSQINGENSQMPRCADYHE